MADGKDLIKRYGGYSGDEDGSYVVFDSRNPKYGPSKQDLGTSAGAEKAASVLNGLGPNSGVTKQDMGIWRGVSPGYGANTYAQRALEGIMDMKNMAEGSDVIVYDTETLGTAPMHRKNNKNLGFYTPTEIGFQHTKMINGQLQPTGNNLSMLLKPNKEVHQQLQGLINNISNGKWTGMTDDVRRTLSDLTLYGGDPGELFKATQKDGRRIVSVNGQSRNLHPLKGSVLTSSKNISVMQKGLDNLMKWGTKPEDAILEMNSFMANMQNTRFAGYNVYNFDQPMMMDYLNNQVGKNVTDSKVATALDRLKDAMSVNQIDGLHAVRTLYRDTFSRYGENVTLETMKKVFRLEGGQSHHALSDVHVTVAQLNGLLKDAGVAETLTNGGRKGTKHGSFNNTSIQVGDRLFGTAGMSSKNAGEHDGIFRMKDGKLTSAYDMQANPIYRNATYKVQNFFDGVKIDGKKMYGVQLYNETDDLHHTIFRTTPGDLESAVHGHLEYIEKKQAKHTTAAETQNKDRAARRWNKMFSTENGGGIGLAERMYGALDIAREGEAKGLDASQIRKKIVGANDYNTDEFVRDFETMRGRLEGEETWIKGFINRIEGSQVGGTSPHQRRSQNMAFSEFGKLMDNEFGVNTVKRQLPNNEVALKINGLEGEENFMRLNGADGVRGSLYGHLYRGHAGKPDMGTIKKRFRDLLFQLKSYNAMDAKKFEQFYKSMDGMRASDSIDNMLGELANTLMRARETNSLNGAVTHIAVEDPTQVRGGKTGRAGKLKDASIFERVFEPLATQAISGATPYQSLWSGKKMPIHGERALNVIETHDQAIQEMLSRNGIGKTKLSTSKVRSSRESIGNLAEAYMKQGMQVQIRYNKKNDALQMILADKNVAESLMNGSMKDIMKSNQTAVVDLPKMNIDGTLTRGAQNRVARLKTRQLRGGGYEVITGFDEILGTLASNAVTVRNMLDTAEQDGEKNGMLSVHKHINTRARKAMQNLSMNNSYGNADDKKKMFEVRSNAANWVRGGAIDVSDFAKEWYTDWYSTQSEERKKLLRLQTPEKVEELAREKKQMFVSQMGMQAERIFQRQSDAFIKNRVGLDAGMHSVKDTHVSNYLRSNLDSRDLLAFGYYNPMARENIMKTVNYASLDESDVRRKLLGQGFSRHEVRRMTKRGVVSSTAMDVMEEFQGDGKISYLNMRAGYMNDDQLQKKASELLGVYEGRGADTNLSAKDQAKYKSYAERLKNPEKISLYDGMILMSEEAASALETTREKKIRLSDGATLSDEMIAVMKQAADASGIPFDLNSRMDFTNLPQIAQNGEKKFTVSQIVKEEVSFGENNEVVKSKTTKKDPNGILDKWNLDSYKLKGWDPEQQMVIAQENVFSANTTKVITDGGGRNTVTTLPGEIVRDLAGAGDGQKVHAIMPSFETSKKMHGTELSKFVSLAVDEAKAQIDGDSKGMLTAGSVAKEDALKAINNLFIQSFGIKDESLSTVKNGQIVIDRLMGTSTSKYMDYNLANMNKFLSGVDNYLGTEFASGKTIYGNVGVGRQDVYDWENGVGLADEGREGLVKYGRKEVDMISARANQVLGKNSAVVGWLSEHITNMAEKQAPDIRRIGSGLIRTSVESDTHVPGQGDVVIRTTGTAFDPEDPLGRERGRIAQNGAREISMHAINELPQMTAKNTKAVSDSYAGTILDYGRAKGSFADGMSFSTAIENNGGTALLEMPDDSFAKKHVRLVDFGDVTRDGTVDTPILRDLQITQQQIWRGIKEYQSVQGADVVDEERLAKVRGRVDSQVAEYQDKAARMSSNARDGGIMKTFASAKMDMAGRFRIQGVNPMANYEKTEHGWEQKASAKYKEGTVYMSENRMLEMIKGKEEKIAVDIMGMDKKTVGNMAIEEIRESLVKTLASDDGKGLYGFVNRYPTIKQSTMQALEFRIDSTMDKDDRGARLGAGTAANLKADYDGDFLSGVLAHYNTKQSTVIHNELRKLQGVEQADGLKTGSKILSDIESDMSSVAKQMNLTVGELSKEYNIARELADGNRNKHQNKLIDLFENTIETRLSAKDAMETREARLGKSFVGIIDNTRDKVLGLATEVMDTLEASGKVSAIRANTYRNTIEETTAAFSQDLISSKKFDIDAEIVRQQQLDSRIKGNPEEAERRAMAAVDERHLKVSDMNEYLLNLTDKNREGFIQHNNEIGLFDVNNSDLKVAEKERVRMHSALDMIQDVQRWGGTANNPSLKVGVSNGQGQDFVRDLLNGEGSLMVPTQANRTLMEIAQAHSSTEHVAEEIGGSFSKWRSSVVQRFDASENQSSSLVDSIGERAFNANDHVLSGATVADKASGQFREMAAKFTPKGMMGGGGMGGAAIAFGAMWAGSAFIRSGPTPEGLQEQTQQPAPVPVQAMQTPTARVTENNGEYVNIRVSAKGAKNMSEHDVAAMVHQEIGAMTSMQMDTTMNVNDNTQNIDQQWLQGVVANVINKGIGF